MIPHIRTYYELLASADYQRAEQARHEALAQYHYQQALEEMTRGTVRRAAEEGPIIDGTARRVKPKPRLT